LCSQQEKEEESILAPQARDGHGSEVSLDIVQEETLNLLLLEKKNEKLNRGFFPDRVLFVKSLCPAVQYCISCHCLFLFYSVERIPERYPEAIR